MRLSEAIRLGSMIRPQAFGAAFEDGKSCAIGAAADAVGLLNTTRNSAQEWSFFDVLARTSSSLGHKQEAACPACHTSETIWLPSIIVHLNDHHKWTREQIADWIDTFESERQPAAASATPVDAVAGTLA
jgi:hypothetical protein